MKSVRLDPLERDIHAAVIKHWRTLGMPGTVLCTVPNMGAMGQAGLMRGVFDLMVMGGSFLRDRTGYIELKREGGKLSKDQEAFRLQLMNLSIPYAVAYGRDEPIRILEEWNIVRRAA